MVVFTARPRRQTNEQTDKQTNRWTASRRKAPALRHGLIDVRYTLHTPHPSQTMCLFHFNSLDGSNDHLNTTCTVKVIWILAKFNPKFSSIMPETSPVNSECFTMITLTVSRNSANKQRKHALSKHRLTRRGEILKSGRTTSKVRDTSL